MKISQYADDTTLIFDGSSVSSTTALSTDIEPSQRNFWLPFMLTTNRETEALTIGIGNEENLNPEKVFKWLKDKVGALGISLSTNPETTIEANYSEEL